MGGGGSKTTVIEAPEPVNVSESMRDYLDAITDPELLAKQLNAESTYGPSFDAVSLARTQTMLEGIKDPTESQAYLEAAAREAGLKARIAANKGGAKPLSEKDITKAIISTLGERPTVKTKVGGRKVYTGRGSGDRLKEDQKAYDKRYNSLATFYHKGQNAKGSLEQLEAELKETRAQMKQIESMPAQKGILEMAEDAARRTQELQTELDYAKRTGDLSQLEELGPKIVEALRKADPEAAKLVDASQARATRAQQRAMRPVADTEERVAMGEIAQQSRDRIAELEALEAEARTPQENQELQNLKSIRDTQTGMFAQAQARAEDPTSIAERGAMGMLGRASLQDALRVGQDPSRFEEFQNLQQLGDMGMLSAEAAQARAMSPNLAEGRGQLGALADAAQREALIPSEERAALGDMAQQSQDFAASLMQQAQNPALPNAERQRLIAMSQQQQARADDIYARAGEVSPEQQGLRNRAQDLARRADEMFFSSGRVTPEQEELRRQSQALFGQADELMATAGDVTPEQQQLRNQASAMQERAQGLFAQAQAAPSEQKQQLRVAAEGLMQQGQKLFNQAAQPSSARIAAGNLAALSAQQARQLSADALGPLSAQRRRMAEQAARQQGLRTGRIGDQMQLASELLNREESRAALRAEAREAQDLAYRQAAGFATDIETDADRLRTQALGFQTGGFDRARGIEGDIDAQRLSLLQEGRLAEGQAFDAGLGIEGQISDQRLAQQGQALDARRLGLSAGTTLEGQISDQEIARQAAANELALSAATEARGIEGMLSQQELDRLAEGRATAGQAFDMGRDVQTDLDDLTKQQQDQALLAQGQAFAQTGDLITADRAARDEAAGRQQAVMSADAAFREEARLERAAAEAQQQGLLDEAQALRDEAATRRSEAMEMQESIAEFDAGLRDEAQAALDREAQLTGGILTTEEGLRQQALDEAAGLRGEISAAEQAAFAQQGQLAEFDESLRATAQAEANTASQLAFNQARNLSAPATSEFFGTSGAAGAGTAAVGQAPSVSQAYGQMFDPTPGVGLAQVQKQNMFNADVANAQIAAQRSSDRSGLLGIGLKAITGGL